MGSTSATAVAANSAVAAATENFMLKDYSAM